MSGPVGLSSKVLIALFVLGICLPFSTRVGPLRMAPSTIYLLLAFVPLCYVWLIRRRTELGLPDLLIWLFWSWATIATILSGGFAYSVQPIGLHLLQTVGAFAAGRVLVRDAASMRYLLCCAFVAVAIVTPFALVEFTTGRPLILEIASKLAPALAPVNMSPRLGFHRVQAFLEHPILYGVFSAGLFAMFFVGFRGTNPMLRWLGGAIAILNAVVTLSTGALLALNMQFGLLLWNRAFAGFRNRWQVLTGLCVAGYVALDLVTTRTPFHTFVRYATFNSGSSFNRIRIWDYGTAEVAANPFFGIGWADWDRPSFMSSSMDNFWLVQAVRYGLPAFGMIAAIPILILLRSRLRTEATEVTRRMMLAGNVMLVSTMVAIVSVHIWNATYVWFMFLLGACVWYTLPSATADAAAPTDPDLPSAEGKPRSFHARRAMRPSARTAT